MTFRSSLVCQDTVPWPSEGRGAQGPDPLPLLPVSCEVGVTLAAGSDSHTPQSCHSVLLESWITVPRFVMEDFP